MERRIWMHNFIKNTFQNFVFLCSTQLLPGAFYKESDDVMRRFLTSKKKTKNTQLHVILHDNRTRTRVPIICIHSVIKPDLGTLLKDFVMTIIMWDIININFQCFLFFFFFFFVVLILDSLMAICWDVLLAIFFRSS